MNLLDQLINNKGTISSALGKSLAKEVLKGNTGILIEAVELVRYKTKNVRAGAAKIIESVAEEKPGMVAPYLIDLIPAFDFNEPQTRWMIIHTFGLCAALNPDIALQMYERAKEYLDKKNGTCLRESAILYYGYTGAVSPKVAKQSFEIMENVFANFPDRSIRALQAVQKFIHHLDQDDISKLEEYIDRLLISDKPTVVKEAKKLHKMVQK